MSQRHAPKGPIKARDPMEPADPMKPTCTATSRSGQRCRKPPILGGMVCRMHGGAAPQVKGKAMERLMALQMPAIARLAELIDQKEYPSVAIAAVKDALDRTLGKPAESVKLTGADDGPLVIRHELAE